MTLVMRQARFIAPWQGESPATYHCVSRVVNRDHVFGAVEKEEFVRLMRLYEAFCGVHVESYSVMSNHFHILVEVPPRPPEGLSRSEFYRRLSILYDKAQVSTIRDAIDRMTELGDDQGVAQLMEKYLYRMWDLSEFMKSLKQRFSRWFNKRHNRRGTLWEERFKSVIVEQGYAAKVVAAYIELNAVRAGMVERARDYRFCSFAEAMAGGERARAGIARLLGKAVGATDSDISTSVEQRKLLEAYGELIQTQREERRRGVDAADASRSSGGTDLAGTMVDDGPREDGLLTVSQMIRHRVRYFVDGWVIGSRRFVDDVFMAARQRFGTSRSTGARPIRGCATTLHSLRDLRLEPVN